MTFRRSTQHTIRCRLIAQFNWAIHHKQSAVEKTQAIREASLASEVQVPTRLLTLHVFDCGIPMDMSWSRCVREANSLSVNKHQTNSDWYARCGLGNTQCDKCQPAANRDRQNSAAKRHSLPGQSSRYQNRLRAARCRFDLHSCARPHSLRSRLAHRRCSRPPIPDGVDAKRGHSRPTSFAERRSCHLDRRRSRRRLPGSR